MLSSEEIEAVATLALEEDLYIISDEIYEKLNFDGRPAISLASIPDIADRVIIINGMSKAYAMTGWRLGWLAGPTRVDRRCRQIQFADGNVSRHFHADRGRRGFERSARVRRDNAAIVSRAARFHRGRLQQHSEYVSSRDIEGAFYAFPKVDETSKTSDEVANIILDEAVVVGVPGSAFGITKDVHIRFSFAEDMNKLAEAVERIRAMAHKLA